MRYFEAIKPTKLRERGYGFRFCFCCTVSQHSLVPRFCSLSLPSNVAELAGLEEIPPVELVDANSIKEQYEGGNITSTETLGLLNFLVDRVYQSTPSRDSNPYACDVNGLAKLSCTNTQKKEPLLADHQPVRSVTLQGWLPSSSSTTISYTTQDFEEMAELGLNTAQIVLPMSVFANNDETAKELLASMLKAMQPSGLRAILALEYSEKDSFDVTQVLMEISSYALTNKDVVLAVTLPRGTPLEPKQMVETVRASVGPELAILVPMDDSDFVGNANAFGIDDPKVYGSLEWYHTNTIGDIASSSSEDDRSKLFYHESLACIQRAPLEHLACHQNMPSIWTFGFDLTIDDCADRATSTTFRDYGQCDRFDETIDSGWWDRHRQSFAARQLYAAEQGLGWSFASWKLSNDDDDDSGTLTPAKLASLRDVVRAGLFPKNFDVDGACLNPPENDFVLGDDTLAPTLGPPPDCGNGWWNYTTLQCKFLMFFFCVFVRRIDRKRYSPNLHHQATTGSRLRSPHLLPPSLVRNVRNVLPPFGTKGIPNRQQQPQPWLLPLLRAYSPHSWWGLSCR